jgi:uncharacterized membrane protein
MNSMHWVGLYSVSVIAMVHSLTYYLFEDGEEHPMWLFVLTRYSAYIIAFIPFFYLVSRKANHKQELFT